MVSMRVEVHFIKDTLNNQDTNEISIQLKEVLGEGAGKDYKDD